MELAENIYFRNVNNNAGIFDYLLAAAEDQGCKEAVLAYHFIHKAEPTHGRRNRGAYRDLARKNFRGQP
jgi:hypothetical protein